MIDMVYVSHGTWLSNRPRLERESKDRDVERLELQHLETALTVARHLLPWSVHRISKHAVRLGIE
jgi:hypothetical protein